MKHLLIHLATAASLLITSQVAMAQAIPGTPAAELAKSAIDMADGEVRKVDKENKKITLKHGLIKNLDMPGMTMVFQVKDIAMLDKVKTGDKVRFTAEKESGAIVITSIESAK